MFKNTKLTKSAFDLPLGVTHPGEVHLSFFDRFGPRGSDSDQHFYTGESFNETASKVREGYSSLNGTGAIYFSEETESSLNSEQHKYVLVLKDEFFHVILNVVSVLLTTRDNDSSASFIVITPNGGNSGYQPSSVERKKNLEFLQWVCDLNNIKVHFVSSEHETSSMLIYPVYASRNVTIIDDFSTALELSPSDISYVIKKYILDKFPQPEVLNKKLYVSRGGDASAESAFVISGDPSSGYAENGVRLYSEPELEEYLVSKGFEVVRIDELESIEKQIELFMEASVLVGITGTGLTNCLFLKDESLVIELKAEILWSTGDHSVDENYFKFGYGKSHYYVTLDVHDKQASTAITKLKRLFESLDLDKWNRQQEI